MPTLRTASPTETPAAEPAAVVAHFADLLRFETDCSDVHAAFEHGDPGFVLLDVRSPTLFAQGHVPGAVNHPHALLTERHLARYAPDTFFVVYCNGPHCNGADRAAIKLALLGRSVKKMIGGIEGWKDEGYSLTTA